jgi:hypothetical protein
MKAWSWVLPAALVAACGGNVVVDPARSGSGASSSSSGLGGSISTGIANGGSIGSGMGNGGGPIVVVGAGGGVSSSCASPGCVMTCLQALIHGGEPCGLGISGSAYSNITACAKTQCFADCPSFLQGCPFNTDIDCAGCLKVDCAMSLEFCSNN